MSETQKTPPFVNVFDVEIVREESNFDRWEWDLKEVEDELGDTIARELTQNLAAAITEAIPKRVNAAASEIAESLVAMMAKDCNCVIEAYGDAVQISFYAFETEVNLRIELPKLVDAWIKDRVDKSGKLSDWEWGDYEEQVGLLVHTFQAMAKKLRDAMPDGKKLPDDAKPVSST